MERPLEVLKGADLDLRPGEIVGLVGRPGPASRACCTPLACWERPTGGEVLFDGRPTAKLREAERTRLRLERIGFVYQFHQLIPELSAQDNVALPLRIAGRPEARRATAPRAPDPPGPRRAPVAPARPAQRRRAAAHRHRPRPGHRPRLILADEPTGNLDPDTSRSVFQALFDLARTEAWAALIATHNLQLASYMDRVFTLAEGRLVERVRAAI